jgi:hypothetical protein
MNDNLLKAAKRLLDAAEGDHNQMTQTDAGHYEFELDLAIRCFKDAHKEYMEQQAEPVAEPVVAGLELVGYIIGGTDGEANARGFIACNISEGGEFHVPVYRKAATKQQAEPNKGNG